MQDRIAGTDDADLKMVSIGCGEGVSRSHRTSVISAGVALPDRQALSSHSIGVSHPPAATGLG